MVSTVEEQDRLVKQDQLLEQLNGLLSRVAFQMRTLMISNGASPGVAEMIAGSKDLNKAFADYIDARKLEKEALVNAEGEL